MKILVILFFFIFGLVQCRVHEKCWIQCDPTVYVAKITCVKEGECKCTNANDEDCGLDLDVIRPDTWEQCYNFAHEQKGGTTGLGNTNFRWENADNTVGDSSICYLLDSCKHISGKCAPYDIAPCVCGPSDDDGCDASVEAKCKAPEWEDNGLHWTCINSDGNPVNPYTEVEAPSLPIGIYCQTGESLESCSTWNWEEPDGKGEVKQARVECGENGWASEDGYLLQTNDDSPIDILPDVKESKDALCKCDTLTLNPGTLDTDGLSLLCDELLIDSDVVEPDIQYGIQYGNTCTLLCDNHFVLYIECYRGVWLNTAVYPFEPVTADEIKC